MTTATDVVVSGVPQAVASELRRVYLETEGHRFASAILAVAADAGSPLHGYFEWDNTTAAEAHRLAQAESLIRRVQVRVLRGDEGPPIAVRAYISRRELPTADEDDAEPGGYLAIEQVAGATDAQAALLQSIQRDVHRLQRKYRAVDAFAEIVRGYLTD